MNRWCVRYRPETMDKFELGAIVILQLEILFGNKGCCLILSAVSQRQINMLYFS